MSIDIYFIDDTIESGRPIQVKEGVIEPTSSPDKPDIIALQLEELLSSITSKLKTSVEVESELSIEITGSVALKAKGELKYLFLNFGAETSSSNAFKVVLKTNLAPAPAPEEPNA